MPRKMHRRLMGSAIGNGNISILELIAKEYPEFIKEQVESGVKLVRLTYGKTSPLLFVMRSSGVSLWPIALVAKSEETETVRYLLTHLDIESNISAGGDDVAILTY